MRVARERWSMPERLKEGEKVFRVLGLVGTREAVFGFFADVIAGSMVEALRASYEGRVQNWRATEVLEEVPKVEYFHYLDWGEVESSLAVMAARPVEIMK